MKTLLNELAIPCVCEPCVGIAADDVHADLTAAEAEEEEAAGDTVDDDVERVGGRHRAAEEGVGDAAREGEPRVVPREAHEAVGAAQAVAGQMGGRRRQAAGGGLDVGVGGCGNGGRFGDAGGLDACLPGGLGQGTATLPKLLGTEGEGRSGGMAAAGTGLGDLHPAVVEEQGLVVLQTVAVGLSIEVGPEGKDGQGGEEEHQDAGEGIPADFNFWKHWLFDKLSGRT